MLYYIVDYNEQTKFAGGIEASKLQGNQTPSGLIVSLFSYQRLEPGKTYSFQPKRKFIGSEYVHGELDYSCDRAIDDYNK